ncbi:MAG: hypothetical protein H0V37_05680, partial [Chloroflexia bacterium]|nr:hypothetical protein [Chloroflexia bacterium]
MPNLSHRCQASVSVMVVCVILAATLVTGANVVQAGQGTNTPSPVDLATVPLHPSSLPEPGFQLAQAGDLEFGAVQAGWSTGGVNHEAWGSIAPAYRHGHSAVHVLLSDRADPWSEPLASVTTFVIGFDSPEAAADAGPALLDIAGYEPTEEVDGVTVYADVDGLLGLRAEGDYLVIVQYAFPEQQNSTRQNTEDWTPESVASLVDAATDRVQTAVEEAAEGAESLGVANVMFYGMQSPWTLPWIYYPSTEHYRVLDGEVVTYGGELAADLDGALPAGIEDLFVSRQQLGDEGYGHLIDVSLARFGSEVEADAFAAEPVPITFPPTWIFNPTYTDDGILPDGATVERVQVDDNLRASGYRTVRREGATVQVVRWLASGNAVVSRDA